MTAEEGLSTIQGGKDRGMLEKKTMLRSEGVPEASEKKYLVIIHKGRKRFEPRARLQLRTGEMSRN